MVKLNSPQFDTGHAAYLQGQMAQVSRSFALVVNGLETPLNYHLSAAYLLCRVIDNIEDCMHPVAWKLERFTEFQELLQDPAQAPRMLDQWSRHAWPGLTPPEQAMMGLESGGPLWQIYAAIPDSARQSVARWTAAMVRGLRNLIGSQQAVQRVKHLGLWLLAGEQDYDQYCYVVAGTVGHMATELAVHHYGFADSVANRLLAYCEACGRALQKTNIVKDFAQDLARGVVYLPDAWLREEGYSPLSLDGATSAWKHKVLGNVLTELRDATQYVLDLPHVAAGYRMASLLCLLPAYETLLQAARRQASLFTADHRVKISRLTMAACQRRAKALLLDNEGILQYSQRMQSTVQSTLLRA